MTWQADVEAFHKATSSTIGGTPALRDQELRAKLIAEEAAETISALGFDAAIDIWGEDKSGPLFVIAHPEKASLPEAMDGIVDLIYVALGTAVAAGVDLQPLWEAVHASNMAKVSGPRREDGKILKPAGWRPPDIKGLIEQQAYAGDPFGDLWEAVPI